MKIMYWITDKKGILYYNKYKNGNILLHQYCNEKIVLQKILKSKYCTTRNTNENIGISEILHWKY